MRDMTIHNHRPTVVDQAECMCLQTHDVSLLYPMTGIVLNNNIFQTDSFRQDYIPHRSDDLRSIRTLVFPANYPLQKEVELSMKMSPDQIVASKSQDSSSYPTSRPVSSRRRTPPATPQHSSLESPLVASSPEEIGISSIQTRGKGKGKGNTTNGTDLGNRKKLLTPSSFRSNSNSNSNASAELDEVTDVSSAEVSFEKFLRTSPLPTLADERAKLKARRRDQCVIERSSSLEEAAPSAAGALAIPATSNNDIAIKNGIAKEKEIEKPSPSKMAQSPLRVCVHCGKHFRAMLLRLHQKQCLQSPEKQKEKEKEKENISGAKLRGKARPQVPLHPPVQIRRKLFEDEQEPTEQKDMETVQPKLQTDTISTFLQDERVNTSHSVSISSSLSGGEPKVDGPDSWLHDLRASIHALVVEVEQSFSNPNGDSSDSGEGSDKMSGTETCDDYPQMSDSDLNASPDVPSKGQSPMVHHPNHHRHHRQNAVLPHAELSESWEDFERSRMSCETCGRRFAPDRIQRHSEVCRSNSTRVGGIGPHQSSTHQGAASPGRPASSTSQTSSRGVESHATSSHANYAPWREKHNTIMDIFRPSTAPASKLSR